MSEELVVKDNSIIIKAELDTQITTANAYPRDEMVSVKKAIDMACIDEETAAECFYALPRKDKDKNNILIEGESIRLAEIVRCTWKHMHTQTRVVEVAERYIVTEAVAWDLQNNNKHIASDRISIWFGEKNGKGGYRANNDMQIVLAKASQAKALRNAIFQVIPKGLVKVVAKAARKFSLGDAKPLVVKVTAAVNKLVKMGLIKEEMMTYFGHEKLEDFTEEDYASLIGIGTALKEKMIKPEDVFKTEENQPIEMSANEKINELLAGKDSPQVTETIDGVTGEVTEDKDLPY